MRRDEEKMDTTIEVERYDIKFDESLDRPTQTGNPNARRTVEKEIKAALQKPGQPSPSSPYTVTEVQLRDLARKYGEQYVSDPYRDVSQWLDIVKGRLNRPTIAPQLALSYFFVEKQGYSVNTTALGVLGEAVAGYCAEREGYNLLLRPVGIMPDAVLCRVTGGQQRISFALVEAKASARRGPKAMIQRDVFEFLVHVKTRVTGFGNDYEAFLVCCYFQDVNHVVCSILCVDLRYFNRAGSRLPLSVECSDIASDALGADPRERVTSLLRLNASLGEVRDAYLASLVREEAKKSGTLALLADGVAVQSPREVDKYLDQAADNLGLRGSWDSARELAADMLKTEDAMVERALDRYRSPELPPE